MPRTGCWAGSLGPAAAAGDDRPGRAVRAAHPDRDHPGGDPVRRRRGDVRRGPGRVAEPGLQRPVALGRRAGAGEPPRRARPERRPGGSRGGPGPGPAVPSLAAQEQAVIAALRAQPGTLHYVAESDDDISGPGPARPRVPDRLRRRRQLDRLRAHHRSLVLRRRPGRRQHRLPHRHRHQGGRQLHAHLGQQPRHDPDRRGDLRPERRPGRRSSPASPPWPPSIRAWPPTSTTWR